MTAAVGMRKLIDPLRSLLASLSRASPEPVKRLLNRVANPFSSPRKLREYYIEGPFSSTGFLAGKERSMLLVDLVREQVGAEASILEVGCNVGRNLNYLFESGFHHLEGIEINERVVRQLRSSYPEMAQEATIHNAALEDVIGDFSDAQFDVVFTMTVLMHIHPDSEWIFPEIARIAKDRLITIENEGSLSWNHFPRDYRKVFEPFGWKELEVKHCEDIEGLGEGFYARVFARDDPIHDRSSPGSLG